MDKKNLYYAAALLAAALVLMVSAMLFTDFKYPAQSQGTLVFADSFKKGAELDKIVIENPRGTITLELQDNLWRVKEAGGYFANTYLLNKLLVDINTSAFYSRRENTPRAIKDFALEMPQSGTRISTYGGSNKYNTVTIGKPADNRQYRFALLENGEIWLVSGAFELPEEKYSWLLQPVLELPPSLIETIRFYKDGKVISAGRQEPYQDFSDSSARSIKAKTLTNLLSHLTVDDISGSKGFDKGGLTLSQRMEIITFQGLVFYFDFYENTAHDETWIQITLSTTPLPMSVVNDYIKDNRFLYDGWYFKLPPASGEILKPASLI